MGNKCRIIIVIGLLLYSLNSYSQKSFYEGTRHVKMLEEDKFVFLDHLCSTAIWFSLYEFKRKKNRIKACGHMTYRGITKFSLWGDTLLQGIDSVELYVCKSKLNNDTLCIKERLVLTNCNGHFCINRKFKDDEFIVFYKQGLCGSTISAQEFNRDAFKETVIEKHPCN